MEAHAHAVFRRVLGADFERLPPALQRAHDNNKVRLTGQADVEIYLGPLGTAVCWMLGLPGSGRGVATRVDFTPGTDGTDHWHRDFAGREYKSEFSVGVDKNAGRLIEKMGIIAAILTIELQRDRPRYEIIGARLLGLPLPRRLSPRCIAYESERDGGFMFDIMIGLPILGRLIAYKGLIR